MSVPSPDEDLVPARLTNIVTIRHINNKVSTTPAVVWGRELFYSIHIFNNNLAKTLYASFDGSNYQEIPPDASFVATAPAGKELRCKNSIKLYGSAADTEYQITIMVDVGV